MAAGFGVLQIGFGCGSRASRRIAQTGIRMAKSSTARDERYQRSREREAALPAHMRSHGNLFPPIWTV